MCTTITPTVFGPMASRSLFGSTAIVRGSQSMNRTDAPAAMAAAAVAKNVFAATSTSLPSTPIARSGISMALVPEFTATAWSAPT